MMMLMWFFWILLIAFVIWGLVRLFTTRRPEAPTHEAPLEVLQRSYAKGEISTEEYEERKRALSD